MSDFSALAKMIMGMGLLLLIIGGIMLLFGKIGLGKLPGDIYIKRENFTFYFPIVTTLLLSLVLSLVLNLLFRR